MTGATLGAGSFIGVPIIMSGTVTTGLGMGQIAQGISERGLDREIPSGAGELGWLCFNRSDRESRLS